MSKRDIATFCRIKFGMIRSRQGEADHRLRLGVEARWRSYLRQDTTRCGVDWTSKTPRILCAAFQGVIKERKRQERDWIFHIFYKMDEGYCLLSTDGDSRRELEFVRRTVPKYSNLIIRCTKSILRYSS